MEAISREEQRVEEEEGYPEEHKETALASLSLVCLMYSSTAEAGPSSNSLLVLRRPYVASLEGIITQCSQPFGKELTKSDVNGSQSRLLLNKADAQKHIYPLLGQDRQCKMKKDGVPVNVFNERGKLYSMLLKSWSCNDKSNVLTAGWTAFVKDMELQYEVDYVTLWAFCHRLTGDLCFLIAVRRSTN